MSALGWLLNLGFAGGAAAVVNTPACLTLTESLQATLTLTEGLQATLTLSEATQATLTLTESTCS